jgi:hypothetical protein
MQEYEIIIYWSNEDQVFVAEVPELPGCMAHSKTQRSHFQESGVMRLLDLRAGSGGLVFTG